MASVRGCVWALALLLPALAHAQQDESQRSTPPEAVELFRQARESYQQGRYTEAAENLERALVLDPASPTLVYNLARVYELLADVDRALVQYRRYLQLLPAGQSEERERAEATIRRLEGARESGVGVEPEQAPEPLRELRGTVQVRERGVADVPFWVTLIGGGAVLAGAAITGGLALDWRAAGDTFVLGLNGSIEERDSRYATASALGLVTDIGFGVGGAAVVAAVLLFLLRENVREQPIQPMLDVAPDGTAWLGARGWL